MRQRAFHAKVTFQEWQSEIPGDKARRLELGSCKALVYHSRIVRDIARSRTPFEKTRRYRGPASIPSFLTRTAAPELGEKRELMTSPAAAVILRGRRLSDQAPGLSMDHRSLGDQHRQIYSDRHRDRKKKHFLLVTCQFQTFSLSLGLSCHDELLSPWRP